MGFRGVLLYASNVLLGRQLTPATQRIRRPPQNTSPTGFPCCWEFLLGCCLGFFFFFNRLYPCRELGVQCNLVIGNHKPLCPAFQNHVNDVNIKCSQGCHKVDLIWGFWSTGKILALSAKISLVPHYFLLEVLTNILIEQEYVFARSRMKSCNAFLSTGDNPVFEVFTALEWLGCWKNQIWK